MIDERTEQLINRRLDGELTSDEQLELNKRLIRSPEARALIEDYQKMDALAHATLDNFSQKSELASDVQPRSRFIFFAGGSAIAAAFILVGFLSISLLPLNNPQKAVVANNPQVEPTMIAALPMTRDISRMLSIEGPRHEREQVHKDVLGVFDQETQSVYLLEMDQQQTTVVPVSMNY